VRRIGIVTLVAAGALALAACGSGGSGASSGSSSASGASGGSASAAAAATDLAAWVSPLGSVVVDGTGRTVYAFDKDTAGAASACTGACVSLWPALTTTSSAPSVSGVTGEVGTAPTADGKEQVTLDGHRLYTFSGDSGTQQLNGQGYMGLWWAVAPDGTTVTATAAPAPPGY
jgi:predicted lipoprotein with Yx(FWY)xxD motif